MTDVEKYIFAMYGRSNPSLLYLVILITGACILIARNYITHQIKVGNQLHQTAINTERLGDNEGFYVCQDFVHKKAELKNLNFSRYHEKSIALYFRYK
jgi:hypothetical protein